MEIDKNLSTELKKFINSRQGNEIKEQLKNADKDKVQELLKNIDFSKVDMNQVADKLKDENLSSNLKIMIEKYLGGRNG